VLLFVAVVMSSPSSALVTHLITYFLLNRLGCSCSCTSSLCSAASSRSSSLELLLMLRMTLLRMR